MRTASEIDRLIAERARKSARALTPGHAAAQGAVDSADADEAARERRAGVQHEVDPVAPEIPEVADIDVQKLYTEALDVPVSPEYPAMKPMASADMFRRGPITVGEQALSPGYDLPGQPVPLPAPVFTAAAISRPLLTDGRSGPSAPGAC